MREIPVLSSYFFSSLRFFSLSSPSWPIVSLFSMTQNKEMRDCEREGDTKRGRETRDLRDPARSWRTRSNPTNPEEPRKRIAHTIEKGLQIMESKPKRKRPEWKH
jgi:hypothetical protein